MTSELFEAFTEFWACYPRKVGKQAAIKAFSKACGLVEDPIIIVAAARRFAEVARGTEARYIPIPTTWLNQGRWEDELPSPVPETHLPYYEPYEPLQSPEGVSLSFKDYLRQHPDMAERIKVLDDMPQDHPLRFGLAKLLVESR